MNWVHIHLMTNHVPVIGTVIGFFILAAATLWKSADLKRFALYYFVALGLLSLVVFFTGEPAEDAVEKIAGVSEAVIERHEEASVFALVGVELLAVLSLAGLVMKRAAWAVQPWFTRAMLGVALVTVLIMGWVANLGGQIRHSEITSVQTATK